MNKSIELILFIAGIPAIAIKWTCIYINKLIEQLDQSM